MATGPTHAHAERDEYAALFAALVFPISKPAILQEASDRGGIDSEVVLTLRLLPDRAYQSEQDLRGAVHAIYLARGVPNDLLPL